MKRRDWGKMKAEVCNQHRLGGLKMIVCDCILCTLNPSPGVRDTRGVSIQRKSSLKVTNPRACLACSLGHRLFFLYALIQTSLSRPFFHYYYLKLVATSVGVLCFPQTASCTLIRKSSRSISMARARRVVWQLKSREWCLNHWWEHEQII